MAASILSFSGEQRCDEKEEERAAKAVEGLNRKVIDFNANFSQTYPFLYFEIFSIVEARYSENIKPICRFNQTVKV